MTGADGKQTKFRNKKTSSVLTSKKKKKAGDKDKIRGFPAFSLTPPVLKAIAHRGWKVPTAIQVKAIPAILEGSDVVAMARTGSGKTAVFLIPLMERLQTHMTGGARALLLSPTRELALQTVRFVKELGRYVNLTTAVIVGGDRLEDDFALMHTDPDIIVATPGRLMHVLVEMELKLSKIEYLVIDEADRLFELGFADQLGHILRSITTPHRQTVLTSATLPSQLIEFAQAGLNNPRLIRLDVEQQLSAKLSLQFLLCGSTEKFAACLSLVRYQLVAMGPKSQCLIFCSTRHHCELLLDLFALDHVPASIVYSSMDQCARKIHMARFRLGQTRVLLVTDLAARGIDLPTLDLVINLDFPATPKLFVHRVGRVARADRSGTAFSIVSNEDFPYVVQLYEFLGTRSLAPQHVGDSSSSPPVSQVDGFLGVVPRDLLDAEIETISRNIAADPDTVQKLKSCDLAAKKYNACKPPASATGVQTAKKLTDTIRTSGLTPHPIFVTQKLEGQEKLEASSKQFPETVAMFAKNSNVEIAKQKILDSIKGYKTKRTIFDISTSDKSTVAHAVMNKKRKDHDRLIRSKAEETEEKNEAKVSDEPVVAKQPRPRVEFTPKAPTVTAKKRKASSTGGVDHENFVPYRSSNWKSESHLKVNSSSGGYNFGQDAASAAFTVPGDESGVMEKPSNSLHKWDRVRKKFVNAEDQLGAGNQKGRNNVKKIRTDHGVRVPASFKKNLYSEWKKRNPDIGDEGGGEGQEDGNDQGGRYNSLGDQFSAKIKRAPSQSAKRGGGGGSRGRGGRSFGGKGGLNRVDHVAKERIKQARKSGRGGGSRGGGSGSRGRGAGGRGAAGRKGGGRFRGKKR